MASAPKQNIELENKVFCRWFTNELSKGNSKIEVKDISKDLSNGVAFVELSKVLTGKEPKKEWAQEPTKPVEMIQNSDLSVQMFFEDGVHLIGIAGKDIHDNNVKIIRGYIWTLIERYSIGRASYGDLNNEQTKKMSFNDILMFWANNRISKYSNVQNFRPYPLAMCALLDSFAPEKVNFANLNPSDNQNNAQLAANVMKELGIPVFINPNESDNDIDIKALLTQLAAARICLEKLPPVPAVKIEEDRIVSKVSDCVPAEEPEPEHAPAPIVEEPHPKCVSSKTSHESVTKNGQTVERTTKIEIFVDENGKGHKTTTVTETTIDPEGHKNTTTNTSNEDCDVPSIDFDHDFGQNDDFDADFNRMKAKMDADFNDFANNHPALK